MSTLGISPRGRPQSGIWNTESVDSTYKDLREQASTQQRVKEQRSSRSAQFPTYYDFLSQPSDESDEEIRRMVERFKRREAARKTSKPSSPESPKIPGRKPPKKRPKKPDTLGLSKTKARGVERPSFLKFWTWNWKGPPPIVSIGIPPPISPDPDSTDVTIQIHYTCGHLLPTHYTPDAHGRSSPYLPPIAAIFSDKPMFTIPGAYIQALRGVAQKEGHTSIVAEYDWLCPNCFLRRTFYLGLFGIVWFWLWLYKIARDLLNSSWYDDGSWPRPQRYHLIIQLPVYPTKMALAVGILFWTFVALFIGYIFYKIKGLFSSEEPT
ncbi:hypothetical protein NHQ30_000739 [Ciborinia camelliae]|nr:hypothetical protein NHQ30_000739 [Ciborinia camelliae]